MRVLAVSPGYIDNKLTGGIITLNEVLTFLASRGHQVEVFDISEDHQRRVIDGVRVYGTSCFAADTSFVPDIVVGHLSASQRALDIASDIGVPLVHIVHGYDRKSIGRFSIGSDLAIACSQAIIDSLPESSAVVHLQYPPCTFHGAGVLQPHSLRKFVSQVNLSQEKGGQVFFELADRIKCIDFLGVRGRHGSYVDGKESDNCKLLESTPDMVAKVFSVTRLLLLPSNEESFGRVCIEAARHGVPTLCRDLPGVQEALGDAGIYLPDSSVDAWVEAISWILTPSVYGPLSLASVARSTYMADLSTRQLFETESRMIRLTGRG